LSRLRPHPLWTAGYFLETQGLFKKRARRRVIGITGPLDQFWMAPIRSNHDEAVRTDYPRIRDLRPGFNEGGFQSWPYDLDPAEQILNSQKVIADLIPSIEYWMNALDHDSEAIYSNLISTSHIRMDGPRHNLPILSPLMNHRRRGAPPRWPPLPYAARRSPQRPIPRLDGTTS
jgi:hypothetical protein